MSMIYLPNSVHSEFIKIRSAAVYDLDESIAASKYPMQVEPNPKATDLTQTATKLAQSEAGAGHDNWLLGVRVAFDIDLTAKALIEAERYHFFDLVSCNSTMHRITKFDLDKAYCRYTDPYMIERMKVLVENYNNDPTPDNYLRVLYSNPAGFTYTMRITTNYRQLKTIYNQRKTHRLPEWKEFTDWIRHLPHSELIIGAAVDYAENAPHTWDRKVS